MLGVPAPEASPLQDNDPPSFGYHRHRQTADLQTGSAHAVTNRKLVFLVYTIALHALALLGLVDFLTWLST